MADSTIPNLPAQDVVNETDLVLLVDGAENKQAPVAQLIEGMPVATTVQKGLMSAADKAAFATLQSQVLVQTGVVTSAVVAAATIALPSGINGIILSGTTTVTAVTGASPFKLYFASYPTGAGVTFLGTPMVAGDMVWFAVPV